MASEAETLDKATTKGESLEHRGGLRPDEVIADKVREMRKKEGGGQRPGQEGISGRRGDQCVRRCPEAKEENRE